MPSGHSLLLCLAFTSLGTACLYCFCSKAQRLRVCQHFLGHHSPQHAACLETLKRVFEPYAKIQVDVSELAKLKDTFGRIIFFLEEKGLAKVPYHLAIPEAAEQIKKEVEQLKAAPACIPPCGFQQEARHFRCATCRIMDCALPIDCPIIDVHKKEGETALFTCRVNFTLPSDTILRWKFAKELRTKYLTFFQDLHSGSNPSLLIQPILQSHHGTFACLVSAEDDVLVRKFFYLNVTGRSLGLQKELQEMFQIILNPPPGVGLEEVENSPHSLQDILSQPDYLHQKNVICLIVGLALGSMLITLVALLIYHWTTNAN